MQFEARSTKKFSVLGGLTFSLKTDFGCVKIYNTVIHQLKSFGVAEVLAFPTNKVLRAAVNKMLIFKDNFNPDLVGLRL